MFRLLTFLLFFSAAASAKTPEPFPNTLVTDAHTYNQIVAHVYDELEFPIYRESTKKVTWLKIVPYLNKKAREIDPEAKVRIGGVRAVIGYLYERSYRNFLKGGSTPQFVEQIMAQKSFSHLDIQGIGSDWDIYVLSKPDSVKAVITMIQREFSSLENHLKLPRDHLSEGLRKQLYPVADVKEYFTQISESMAQGGSRLDWLTYDADLKQMVEPAGAEGTIAELEAGGYTYASPSNQAFNTDKQIVRFLRPLGEAVYLQVLNPEVPLELLRKLTLSVESGIELSPPAIEALARFVRNTRISAGNNRFVDFPPSEVPTIEGYVKRICDYYRLRRNIFLIPELVPFLYTHDAHFLPVPDELKAAVISPADFLRDYTDQGKLYHFTDSAENSLLFLRSGMKTSNANQGNAHYGSGGYLTKDSELNYRPFRTEMAVNPERVPVVIDLDRLAPSLLKKWENLHSDLNKFLAKTYGFTFIYHQHLMLQDSDAIRVEQGIVFNSLLHSLQNQIVDTQTPILQKTKLFLEFRTLFSAYSLLSKEVIHITPPPVLKKLVLAAIQAKKSEGTIQSSFAVDASLLAMGETDEEFQVGLQKFFTTIQLLAKNNDSFSRDVIRENRAICIEAFKTLFASKQMDRPALLNYGFDLFIAQTEVDDYTIQLNTAMIDLYRNLTPDEQTASRLSERIQALLPKIENPFLKVLLARQRVFFTTKEVRQDAYRTYLIALRNVGEWCNQNANGHASAYTYTSEVLNYIGASLGRNVAAELPIIFPNEPALHDSELQSLARVFIRTDEPTIYGNIIHSLPRVTAEMFADELKTKNSADIVKTAWLLNTINYFPEIPADLKSRISDLQPIMTKKRVLAAAEEMENRGLLQTLNYKKLFKELLKKPAPNCIEEFHQK